ncbi:UPF0728 protein C10orf53 homolog [Ostrinia furnacalis]|uniref:UPF0728 protein C10orf53 homolog n=2 Tax=Ostrinia furnacalis TaxID=93504 RepID=UPI0010406676|nr:UPF0728 protein C10orf53 homolog [Ostrinia furnacalis]
MSFQYVTIYYGPCDSFHTVAHKPQKLRGLRDRLQTLGYRVDLVQVLFVNYCMLEICGHEVFRCNIQNLLFNMPYESDPVCQRAVKAVQQATVMLNRARNHLWIWKLIEEQIFVRSAYAPKDFWTTETTQLTPFSTCLDCVKCCGILAQKK